MKNNRIKLTESQLHQVIKESVSKILEAQIDPRSWAAMANKYKSSDPQKSQYAQQRAVQSFNRANKTTGDIYYGMNDDYSTQQRYLDPNCNYSYETTYDPTKNEYTAQYGGRKLPNGASYEKTYGKGVAPNSWMGRENNVARQMATGTGKYDKNNGGWQ